MNAGENTAQSFSAHAETQNKNPSPLATRFCPQSKRKEKRKKKEKTQHINLAEHGQQTGAKRLTLGCGEGETYLHAIAQQVTETGC